MPIPGYEIPIHRSLTEQILLGGVPRTIAILNGTFIAALGLGLHSFMAIPLGIILHVIAVAATRKDPQFFDCFRRHVKQKNFYSA
jgi:type IV secretory pathway TrbD component